MKYPSGALLLSAAISWSAAAPAASGQTDIGPSDAGQIGPFTLSSEFDIDLTARLDLADDSRPGAGDDLHMDARWRVEAEAVTASANRWGAALTLGARTRDGRRGLERASSPGGAPAGLVTGLGGGADTADADEPAVGATQAEIFYKTALFEVFAGYGAGAARRERFDRPGALRLTGADGALIDPVGAALADTSLSLSEPALQVTVRTRRLAGVALAVSFTPEGDPCGLERCLNAAYGEVDQIISGALNFDRRSPVSRVRWRLDAGFETGQARAGPLSGLLEDPYLISLSAARESGAFTLSAAVLQAHDGVPDSRYRAFSASVAMERGDWLFDAELGRGESDLISRSAWTAQLGGSRLTGRRGLLGAAIQFHDGGAALIAEAGLRF